MKTSSLNKSTFLSFIVFILSSQWAIGSCKPDFSLTSKWRGGDAVYSIDLDESKTLWLFGDSFISHVGRRQGSFFIGNSIGISECREGKWNITYHWKHDQDGNPQDFFPAESKHYRYWPKDAIVHNGHIYALLVKVRQTDPNDPMGFETFETVIAKLTPTSSSPDRWPLTYLPLLKSYSVFPGASLYKDEHTLYLYSIFHQDKKTPMIILSLPLDKLDSPEGNLSYLARDGRWKKDQDFSKAQVILENGSHELSVRYNEPLKRWRLIINGAPFTDEVYEYLSNDPKGPWMEKKILHRYKEMQQEYILSEKRQGQDHEHVFCYAPKEHPRYQIFTYVCNSFDARTIWLNETIYLPVVIPLH